MSYGHLDAQLGLLFSLAYKNPEQWSEDLIVNESVQKYEN
jgi:hypothetical protein